ncbi:MAG: pantoate--beta-alanine ligase [Cytophagales bacterium]|nr:MAG: pantoate--beta-alanine ligase [Cytophagales bacterium]
MQVCHSIAEIKAEINRHFLTQSIGFVPTMGALHDGHLSLIQSAKQENGLTVCSIFVNPTQFNNAEDLLKYPRTVEKDLEMLSQAGCDIVFLPSEGEMYPAPLSLSIHFGHLETILEGAHRIGHFKGVGVVVAKLLNIVKPTHTYFGQKDLQQFLIIKQLVSQLNFETKLRCCPIVREKDGLAMSSRNIRLSEKERQIAPKIYEALLLAYAKIKSGESLKNAQNAAITLLNDFGVFEVEYLEIVNADDLSPANTTNLAICTAVTLGSIRLIDNILINL